MTVTWTLPKWFLLYLYPICTVVRVSNTLGGLLFHSSAYNQRLAEHNIAALLQIEREGIVTAAIVWKAFHSLIVCIYKEKWRSSDKSKNKNKELNNYILYMVQISRIFTQLPHDY